MAGAIWDSLMATHGFAVGMVGTLITTAGWLARPGLQVPLFVFILSLLVLGTVCLTLIHAVTSLVRNRPSSLCAVDKRIPSDGTFKHCFMMFLAETSPVPARGSSVTFLRIHNDVESHLGTGEVRWAQDTNGKIQVSLDDLFGEKTDPYIESLFRNDGEAVKQLRLLIGHIPSKAFAVKQREDAEPTIEPGEGS